MSYLSTVDRSVDNGRPAWDRARDGDTAVVRIDLFQAGFDRHLATWTDVGNDLEYPPRKFLSL
jgi:hypothetical protein